MLVTPGEHPAGGIGDAAAVNNALVTRTVAAQAPRLFAITERTLEAPVDVHVVGWGLAFADGAEVVSVSGDLRASLTDAENAEDMFPPGEDDDERMVTRLVWLPHPA